MTKPLIVYVSGAPGSGKTTLAKLLSEQLYIPHVSSDLIHGGVAFTQPEHNREQTLLDVFVPTMIDMSKKGVSFVVDQVLQKGASEVNIIDKLRPYAHIVNVHTTCSDPIERYKSRILSSDLPNIVERREHLLERASHHKANLEKTNQPLELDLPLIVVNTDDAYDPSLQDISNFITASFVD
jgi:adenylate kinase family enzyme